LKIKAKICSFEFKDFSSFSHFFQVKIPDQKASLVINFFDNFLASFFISFSSVFQDALISSSKYLPNFE